MTRSIIIDGMEQEQTPTTPPLAQAASLTANELRVQSDTLAGAFPAWDLVPMVHFVRRVK